MRFHLLAALHDELLHRLAQDPEVDTRDTERCPPPDARDTIPAPPDTEADSAPAVPASPHGSDEWLAFGRDR
jgi:hypothetical protein